MELNDLERAMAEFETAIKLNAKRTLARSQLAWILSAAPSKRLRNGKRALKLAQQACDQNVDEDWLPPYSLAAAFAELGQFDAARAAIDDSMDLVEGERHDWLEKQRSLLEAEKPLRITEHE